MPCSRPPVAEAREVVVVGAGMAGLACAERLSKASVDFVVLEAADRIGGRVLTDHSVAEGRPLEIGALMIHGKHACTHRWVEECGLHARSIPTFKRARWWRDGRYTKYPWMLLPFHPTFGPRAFYQAVYSLPKKMARFPGPDLSLADWLDRVGALPGARQIVTLLQAHAAAAEPDEVGVMGPANEATLAEEEFGYNNFQLVEGYSELLARRSVPLRERIRLGTRVTGIRRSSNDVRVEAVGGDGKPAQEIRAKRVVVALPLGILKAGVVAFEPPLSVAKRRAIEVIAFGDAMALQMRLKGGNLMERLGDFSTLWGGTPSTFHRPYVAARDPPRTLAAFITGKEARGRSAMGDAELLQVTIEELEMILPSNVQVGEVEAMAVGRWPTDPFIRGGYTFLPPHATVDHRKDLATPEDGVLFFAGEATHTHGEPATVHGAIETGYRAADEVLASLRGAPP